MDRARVVETIHREWLCFIMRGETCDETVETVDAVIAGGARVVEVAFTTPNVIQAIRDLRKRHGIDIVLAAGTVTTVEQARAAIDNGADVIVSPDLYLPVVEMTLRLGAVSIPGCLTPTEVSTALRAGVDLVKIFPADVGGPQYLRYIHGPFPTARLVPAGSVTLENMAAYHAAGAYAGVAGVTTELGLRQAISEGAFEEVAATTRLWLERRDSLTTAAVQQGAPR